MLDQTSLEQSSEMKESLRDAFEFRKRHPGAVLQRACELLSTC
jgi:hypothetical protein